MGPMQITTDTTDRADRAAWLSSQGINPAHVPADTDFTEEDSGATSLNILDLDRYGRAQMDPDLLRLKVKRVSVPVSFEKWRAEQEPEPLKGKALDAALVAAGLATSGTAEEKRARLAGATIDPAEVDEVAEVEVAE